MTPQQAAADAELEIVRAAYVAYGRGDVDAAVADLHPNVEWIEPDEFPDGGRHVGRDAVRTYLQRSLAQWQEFHSVPTVYRRGSRIVVEHRVSGVLLDGTRNELAVSDVFTLQDGRVTHMHAYLDPAEVPG